MDRQAGTPDPINNQGRIRRSLRLTATAWGLIRRDRTMLAIAVLSTILTLGGATLIFAVGGYFDHPGGSTPRLGLIWIIASFPLTWIATYLNVALAAAASEALDGRRLGLRQALGVAQGRLLQITTWALLATAVGILIREVLGRIPWGGRIATAVAGSAWSLATLFAVPILALEGCSALSCAERSAKLFKARWGEGVAGALVIGAWTVIVGIPAGLAIGVGAGIHEGGSAGAGIALMAAGLVGLTTVVAFASAAREVFAVALYRYAQDPTTPRVFPASELARPLVKRRRRRR
jgi:hypothetical protein